MDHLVVRPASRIDEDERRASLSRLAQHLARTSY
jgi:hypothetical protein